MHDGAVEPDGSGGDEPGEATSEDASAVLDVYDTRPCLRGLSKEDQRSARLAWLVANNKMSAEVAEGASETDIARAWRRPRAELRRVVHFQSWNQATRGFRSKHSALAFEYAWQKPHSSRHTARMWGVLGMSECSVRTSVSVRRRALSMLLGHGVLGHEPLSVCEVA